ncbi:MAG TPA: DUF4442 domain-containing protein [Flavobacteriales bacterium]|nr:DUF4442 domain-containing protein [Flavobacteriales bacterium]
MSGNPHANSFRKLVLGKLTFTAFLLKDLPMAFIAGIRVREMTDEKTVVTIPYKWLTKNPFRSMYFACLSMAAELSTGVTCRAAVYKRSPSVTTLVLGIEGDFTKKAVGLLTFTCREGHLIDAAVQRSIDTGEAQTVKVKSVGTDQQGEEVATFYFTWSFKQRSK